MPDVENRLTDLEQKVQALVENQEAIAADAARLPESLVLNFRILSRNLNSKFAVQDRKIDALATDVAQLKVDVSNSSRMLAISKPTSAASRPTSPPSLKSSTSNSSHGRESVLSR